MVFQEKRTRFVPIAFCGHRKGGVMDNNGQGVLNKLRLTTIYVPVDKNEVWVWARIDAILSHQSLSQYIIGLIEKDQKERDSQCASSTKPILKV
jgi:hypothetical protein